MGLKKSLGTLCYCVGSVGKGGEVTFVSCLWVRSNEAKLSKGKFRLAIGNGWH